MSLFFVLRVPIPLFLTSKPLFAECYGGLFPICWVKLQPVYRHNCCQQCLPGDSSYMFVRMEKSYGGLNRYWLLGQVKAYQAYPEWFLGSDVVFYFCSITMLNGSTHYIISLLLLFCCLLGIPTIETIFLILYVCQLICVQVGTGIL